MGHLKIMFRVAILLVLACGGAQVQAAQTPADEPFAQGFALLQAGDAQAAKDKFETGLQTAPRNPLAHFFLGKAYFILEKYDPAKTHLEKSLEIDPTNQYARDARALLKTIADAAARANREIADWAGANGSHNAAPLQLYLQEFPNGEHAADAKSQLAQVFEEQAHQAELSQQESTRQAQKPEDDAWKDAQHLPDGSLLGTYLKLYPNGRYADNAKEMMARPKIDSLTKLMWAGTDNAYGDDGNGVNWSDAENYCRSLGLGGYTDWRLPSKEEFLAIDRKHGNNFVYYLHGRSPWWTSTKKGADKAILFYANGATYWERIKYSGNWSGGVGFGFHAMCVRVP